jgi:hypothetical protein
MLFLIICDLCFQAERVGKLHLPFLVKRVCTLGQLQEEHLLPVEDRAKTRVDVESKN